MLVLSTQLMSAGPSVPPTLVAGVIRHVPVHGPAMTRFCMHALPLYIYLEASQCEAAESTPALFHRFRSCYGFAGFVSLSHLIWQQSVERHILSSTLLTVYTGDLQSL